MAKFISGMKAVGFGLWAVGCGLWAVSHQFKGLTFHVCSLSIHYSLFTIHYSLFYLIPHTHDIRLLLRNIHRDLLMKIPSCESLDSNGYPPI